MTKYFITGTGTDVGKTIVSAIFVEAFGFDYWKPVQCGDLDNPDSGTIQKRVSRKDFAVHPESIRLSQPLSPHAAAKHDHVEINLESIELRVLKKNLIIEGAGGVLVPLNEKSSMADLIQKSNARVIIVSRHYLGSINHSLLTFEALEHRGINVLGWVFNGEENPSTEEIILFKSGRPALLRINAEKEITPDVIVKYAEQLKIHAKLFQ